MTRQQRIEEFEKWISKINREGVEDFKDWLIQETDFFDSPASSKYHGNFEGGLVIHSLNVLNICIKLYSYFRENYNFKEISKESLVLVCLFHDICKVNVYKEGQQWYKGDDTYNKWIAFKTYKYEDDFPLGHGEKSLYLIQKFIKLTNEEACSIRWHMASSEKGGEEYMWQAMNRFPLCRLLHSADMSSLCVEDIVDYKKKEIEGI